MTDYRVVAAHDDSGTRTEIRLYANGDCQAVYLRPAVGGGWLVRNDISVPASDRRTLTSLAGMSEHRDPATDQPLPKSTSGPYVHDLVRADVEARKQLGIRKYGTALQADNGRSMLLDAYHEALDLVIYLRGLLEELDGRPAESNHRPPAESE